MSNRKSIQTLLDEGAKVKQGYKLLNYHTNDRRSWYNCLPNEAIKFYHKGRWARRNPSLGGLLVFKTKRAAYGLFDGLVVKCEYIATTPHRRTQSMDMDSLKQCNFKGPINRWPDGTDFAEAVRCVE